MRLAGAALAIALLAVIAAAAPVAAKTPFEVGIYRYGTGEAVAVIETEDGLVAWTSALFHPDAVNLPPELTPATWDYRMTAYWDSARQYPTDLFYSVPRDGHLGILSWPEASRYRTDVPDVFLRQSKAFDEFMARYTGVAPPENPTPLTLPADSAPRGDSASVWIAVAGASAAIVLGSFAVVALRRRAAHREDPES